MPIFARAPQFLHVFAKPLPWHNPQGAVWTMGFSPSPNGFSGSNARLALGASLASRWFILFILAAGHVFGGTTLGLKIVKFEHGK